MGLAGLSPWLARLAFAYPSRVIQPTLASHTTIASWRYLSAAAQPATAPQPAQHENVVYDTDSIPLHTGRPRLVVLGTGWAAARLLKDIDAKLYDLTVISNRNHMVFTPLLASTTVGTLDPRSVAVHMRDIQKALFQPQNGLFIAEAKAVFPERKMVECQSEDGLRFYVNYDKLVIATGSQGSTFGIPGVLEHAFFLRDVKQAMAIRDRLIENIAQAGVPGRPVDEWQRLLHIVIVGGGPTGVEVAGELTDFINHDLLRLYPERARAMRVTIIEAKELLGSFDASLREYAARKLIRRGVQLRKGVVRRLTATTVELQDGSVIPCGLCIWSTGVGPTPFTVSLPFAKTSVGRVAVDGFQRVLSTPKGTGAASEKVSMLAEEKGASPQSLEPVPGVYALGDCCANPDNPLPALAQVAEQQGRYLAKILNEEQKAKAATTASTGKQHDVQLVVPQFEYRHLGSMATVGGHGAVLELSDKVVGTGVSLTGFTSWVAWRSAYLTRLGSIPKRLSVAFDWTMTLIFGRDMSRW